MNKALSLLALLGELNDKQATDAVYQFYKWSPKYMSDDQLMELEDEFRAMLHKTPAKEYSPEDAKLWYVTHKLTHDEDPDSRYKGNAKDYNDPAIGVKFQGNTYLLDGQHRTAYWIKNNQPVKAIIVDGDWMQKFGVTTQMLQMDKKQRYK